VIERTGTNVGVFAIQFSNHQKNIFSTWFQKDVDEHYKSCNGRVAKVKAVKGFVI